MIALSKHQEVVQTEIVDTLPYGLVACRLNGRQATVTALSDRLLCLRTDDDAPAETLSLSFLRLRHADRCSIIPAAFREIETRSGRLGFERRFEIEDPAYRRDVLRVLGEYAEYIRWKADGDDAVARPFCNLPRNDETAATFQAQKHKWFTAPGHAPTHEYELALSLSDPSAYDRFMFLPFDAFQKDFFERNGLSHHPLFCRPATRVYLGNPCCFRLLPEDYPALLERCTAQGLRATIVLPPVREHRAADLERLLNILEDSPADEIVFNDWGTLTRLKGRRKTLLLGTQLNRRRKDPRMRYKPGFTESAALLAENSLNDPAFSTFLNSFGVRRFEYEVSTYPIRIAPGRHSLHLPFFQTNTSHACPLAATLEGRDPGLPYDERSCPRPCLQTALLYPDALEMVGRYNSLFGVDRTCLTDDGCIDKLLSQGIDRIVTELL